jgi:hypothetical protein
VLTKPEKPSLRLWSCHIKCVIKYEGAAPSRIQIITIINWLDAPYKSKWQLETEAIIAVTL